MQAPPARPVAGAADDPLPAWFETLFPATLLAYLAFAVLAVVTALLGVFHPGPMALAVPLAVAFVLAWRRGAPRPTESRSGSAAAACAVLLVLAVTTVNARYASQHLIVDNDPGVYATTALDVADDGDLLVETDPDVFGRVPGVTYAGAGYYPTAPDDSLYPQFPHLLPLTLAAGEWLGGPALMLRTTALLGGLALLSFFALAARAVRPWWALLATAVLSVNFPQVYFSRDTFSEVLSQALLMGGLALLWRARDGGNGLARGALAGATIGATGMARVDAYIYLAPLVIWAGWTLLRLPRQSADDHPRLRGLAVGAVVGAATTTLLGYAEVRRYSPLYLRDLSPQVRLSIAGVAAAALLVAVALGLRRPVRRGLDRLAAHTPVIAATAAGLVVALAAFAWLVRPSVQTAMQFTDYNPANIEGLQRLEGQPIAGNRTYFEESVRWLQWYLGPITLAAGFGGAALLVWRVLRGRAEALIPFVLVLATTAYYVYRPSITPIHIFADRRFVPVAYPGLILCAVALCAALWSSRAAARPLLRVLAVVIAAASLVVPLRQLADMPDVRHGVPLLSAVEDTCDELDEDAAVLLAGGLRSGLPVTLAAACDVPVAVAPDRPSAALLRQVADAVAASGRRLVLLVDDPALLPAGIGEPVPVVDVAYTRLEPSLTKRPTMFRASARLVIFLVEL